MRSLLPKFRGVEDKTEAINELKTLIECGKTSLEFATTTLDSIINKNADGPAIQQAFATTCIIQHTELIKLKTCFSKIEEEIKNYQGEQLKLMPAATT